MNDMMLNRKPGARKHGRLSGVALLAAALMLSACDLDVANTNAPSLDELTDDPTPESLARVATGIFSDAFSNIGTEIEFYALYGREGYDLQGNDPRETGEQIRGPRDPSGRNASIWVNLYNAIRTINTYLDAVDAATGGPTGLTEAEASASTGFAKTMKAWLIHRLAVRTGELGIPIDIPHSIDAEPAQFVSFAEAMAEASKLLDEGLAELQAGGGQFPFSVAPGYSGFETPASFATFNRALAAKVLVHRATFVDCMECWDEASAALDESFVTDAGLPNSLSEGVYYAYSTAANELANPVTEPLTAHEYWVHPSILDGVQLRADGSPDLRLTEKVMDAGRTRSRGEPVPLVGTHKPVLYNSSTDRTSPDLGAWIPWITNEELLLLRAEIRWHTNDRAGAVQDIDTIREHSGGLPSASITAGSSDDEFVTELLYNRLYSLMWSQGTRWIDARRYDRLDSLPIDREGDSIYENMLIPADECAARGQTSTANGCS